MFLIRNERPKWDVQRPGWVFRASTFWCAGIFALLVLLSVPARAGTIYLAGAFASDDDEQTFNFTLTSPRALIETTSYARGGFDPVLSVFDAAGSLVAMNDNGSCSQVAADPVAGACLDSYLPLSLAAGSYSVVLTEYDNLPDGPFLSDGFTETGDGDFTGNLFGQPGQSFIDFTGNQRTDSWAVAFSYVSSVSEAPEPGSLWLFMLAITLVAPTLLFFRRNTK